MAEPGVRAGTGGGTDCGAELPFDVSTFSGQAHTAGRHESGVPRVDAAPGLAGARRPGRGGPDRALWAAATSAILSGFP
jgi:hypothetical protein